MIEGIYHQCDRRLVIDTVRVMCKERECAKEAHLGAINKQSHEDGNHEGAAGHKPAPPAHIAM